MVLFKAISCGDIYKNKKIKNKKINSLKGCPLLKISVKTVLFVIQNEVEEDFFFFFNAPNFIFPTEGLQNHPICCVFSNPHTLGKIRILEGTLLVKKKNIII